MGRPEALVIEDSPETARLMGAMLERDGYRSHHAPDGARGMALARAHHPELILLDLSLPDSDGVDVCRQLREITDAYIVMVTSRTDDVDKVVGLTVGADDYVTKPFSPRELTARIRAMRRRPRVPQASVGRVFGPLVVDPVAHEAILAGNPLDLTKIEFDLLDLLSSAPRQTFTREQLLKHVWGEWFGDDHVIDVHIGNLRRKIGESASAPKRIRTVRGVGYRFEPTLD
jgi:DNA-binding response OmpR family regulator